MPFGLIVMPKERIISYIPLKRLTQEFKKEIGFENSKVNGDIKKLKELIIELRHSIAHFDIKVESHNKKYLIDEIVFMDNINSRVYEIVRFKANELLPFIKYYSSWLMDNLKKYRRNS